MVSGSDETADDALEDIAYLSRSSNRVDILAALATEPHTRHRLRAVTNSSRTTLARILNELEERGWAERTTDGDYVATPTGELVVAEFTPLVGAMQTVRRLGDATAWLPTDELSIGVHHFKDATIRQSAPTNPVAAATHILELVRDASEFACLAHVAPPVEMEKTMRDVVVAGQLTTDYVLTGDLVEYLRDQPGRRGRWEAYVEAGASVYRYDGSIPCNLFVVDETVFLGNSHPDVEQACALIEVENDAVRSWARELIGTYRSKADSVDAEAFQTELSVPADEELPR